MVDTPSKLFPSSKEGDTTLSPDPPYSSEGPTLPLLGGGADVPVAAARRGDIPSDDLHNTQDAQGPRKKTKKRKAGRDPSHEAPPPAARQPSIDLAPLHTPWELLPPEVLALLTQRLGAPDWWRNRVVAVPFSKNQNIAAGINRLQTYLGAHKNPHSPVERPAVLDEEGAVIAVGALGDATVKLVGIVEMLKRVVAPEAAAGKEEGVAEGVATWYMYTSLASRTVEKKVRSVDERDANGAKGTEEDAFEPLETAGKKSAEQDKTESARKTLAVPVLLVWMSRQAIPEFRGAFGEQTFLVRQISRIKGNET
ncbi:hypothetical protein BDV95DRAFT_492193 [Massariosphaeria phaeospora]|uniref:Uncharacterized protein n=1 Tax=Massariosphaeria phaeospora TaxID=100035 RepID=A0A7C8IAK1_9PLEO|nr:hypothetical protein BDV95DRAFT_492193 [Massariosphaeria phaeospora]